MDYGLNVNHKTIKLLEKQEKNLWYLKIEKEFYFWYLKQIPSLDTNLDTKFLVSKNRKSKEKFHFIKIKNFVCKRPR